MDDLQDNGKDSTQSYLNSEDRLRSLLMNELRSAGATAWDCKFENCPEKVFVDGIPFRVLVGDIVFKWKDILRLIELKLLRRFCANRVMKLKFGQTTPAQIRALADGAGFFVMVAEPIILPRSKCLSCEERLELLHDLLVENRICYEAVVLDQQEFLKIKKEYIDELKYVSGTRFGEEVESFKGISFNKVLKIMPDAFICFKMKDIKKLITKILSKI